MPSTDPKDAATAQVTEGESEYTAAAKVQAARTADPAEGAVQGGGASDGVAPAKRTGRRVPGWISWTACVLVLVLSGVLTIASMVARYADNTLLNTDRYVAMVGPLARDGSVKTQIVDVVTDRIMSRIDVETMTASVIDGIAGSIDPEKRPILSDQATQRSDAAAAALAPVVYGQVESLVRKTVTRVVDSDAFVGVWNGANRSGHRAIVYIVTGEGDVVGVSKDGVVRVSLGPVVEDVRAELTDRGFSFADKIPAVDPQLELGKFPQLAAVQNGVAWLGRAATWLPWLVLALGALAVWVAPARRRTVALVGGTWAVAGLLVVGAIAFGRGKYLDALPPSVADDATGVVYNRITGPLRGEAIWTVVVGLLVVAGVVGWSLWKGGRDAPEDAADDVPDVEGPTEAGGEPAEAQAPAAS